MLNLDNIEYVTIYNVWFCIRLIIILIPIGIGVGMFFEWAFSPYLEYYNKRDGFISGLIFSFFISLAVICFLGKTNYAKVEIVDKEKCIEIFGENPQDGFRHVRSEGDKFYYYYVLGSNLEEQNEDELKNSIEETFNNYSLQAEIKNKTKVIKK
ncbi:hypothetical protein [Peptoniphilus harei]|uniref:Uncharacterized protein n=1 Tax=Peptoniphilus harei TaxID=54005 RepID=A0A943SPT4_9FIRM|nr:hypothetical protein [Peptoniphilus harei]MBS6535840.1 hypothetical protein [Peptoniphilus harei]